MMLIATKLPLALFSSLPLFGAGRKAYPQVESTRYSGLRIVFTLSHLPALRVPCIFAISPSFSGVRPTSRK